MRFYALDVVRVHNEAERGKVVRHRLPEVLPPHLPENQGRHRLQRMQLLLLPPVTFQNPSECCKLHATHATTACKHALPLLPYAQNDTHKATACHSKMPLPDARHAHGNPTESQRLPQKTSPHTPNPEQGAPAGRSPSAGSTAAARRARPGSCRAGTVCSPARSSVCRKRTCAASLQLKTASTQLARAARILSKMVEAQQRGGFQGEAEERAGIEAMCKLAGIQYCILKKRKIRMLEPGAILHLSLTLTYSSSATRPQ